MDYDVYRGELLAYTVRGVTVLAVAGMLRPEEVAVAHGAAPSAWDALSWAQLVAVARIDGDIDAIRNDVMGTRSTEYEQAEADALAFKAANYTGAAGNGVTSWSAAKGWTDKAAADDILVTAAQWRAAQAAMRTQRLGLKEQAKAAPDQATLDAVLAGWAAFVAGMRQALGV